MLKRWLILTIAICLTPYIISGISVRSFVDALIAALILGILNIIIKPVLKILTLPINIITLGLFTLVINAILLEMVAWLIPGFSIVSFWSAILGGLFISIVSWILGWIF
ncbi:MAG TPA: phage holin family protein [bacterium]|nr:phage holin family protein [Dictyoglomota bacterium]HHV81191.1 phage holin family protein [bacterium]HOK29590.1 phage holin family protein [bacterium]HOL54490.1 phage holin family protein [bacterium]HOP55819.1 phage holin family protein [bacterium]